jgi:starvation-inducible outer membrane lipoprotein
MKTPKGIIISMCVLIFLVSCAGAPKVPFKTMVQEADSRVGEDVILGGYILDSHMSGYRMDIRTNITVLQTPLEWNTKPQTKDKSEGSFFVSYLGKFNAQDYEPEDRITVTGTIAGLTEQKLKHCPNPCLKIEGSKIRMWREHEHYFPPSRGPL